MTRQLSTSVSDLVLALSVVYFVYCVFWDNVFAALGLLIQGVAAGLGVYRFALSRPDSKITNYHKMMSWTAQVVGVPLLGVGFANNYMPLMVNLNFLFVIAAVVASRFVDDGGQRKLLTEAASGFGMLTVILVCLRSINLYGLFGAAAYVGSGLAIGSEGHLHGIPRVDILHYVLAVGNLFFVMALV
ncbi:uncharacterized protein LOC143285395 [Babylonia areolata]|uniref:uncharacterized protein LOC143285395 n=1 Tax=Babylonia areolata TaxID=304850 RepID=UPI003FD6A9C0